LHTPPPEPTTTWATPQNTPQPHQAQPHTHRSSAGHPPADAMPKHHAPTTSSRSCHPGNPAAATHPQPRPASHYQPAPPGHTPPAAGTPIHTGPPIRPTPTRVPPSGRSRPSRPPPKPPIPGCHGPECLAGPLIPDPDGTTTVLVPEPQKADPAKTKTTRCPRNARSRPPPTPKHTSSSFPHPSTD